jgi:predicted Holliday junction resolvase-like endonuclease
MWFREYIIVFILVLLALVIGYFIWLIKNKVIEKKVRKDAVNKSRWVLVWNMTEQIAPLLPDFKYTPKDMMFLWKWVDYIVFEGLSTWKLEKIIFLEIKTWKSQLNKNERAIKNAVQSWKVSYEIYRK